MGKIRPISPGNIFGRRVREERLRQRLTQDEVVQRLERLGIYMDRSNLGRIERGETTGQLDNLMALALALGVAPVHLMVPHDGEEEVELTPKRKLSSSDCRLWIRGAKLLEDSDPLPFFAAMGPQDQQAVALRGVSPLAAALLPDGLKRKATDELRDAVEEVLAQRALDRPTRSRTRKHKEEGNA